MRLKSAPEILNSNSFMFISLLYLCILCYGNQEIELMKLIKFWIKPEYLEVRVVNSERATHNVSPDEWNTKSGWILIGAGKLDRGFVVKNLAVTYMPRGIGGGNVDTIQQRGRFFGYKANYLELLRGWFSEELINSYASIVETESSLRNNLKKYDDNSINLMSWKRSMIMDPALTPTRKNIIDGINWLVKDNYLTLTYILEHKNYAHN